MNYIKGRVVDYLDDLAAKMPAPGGGSVAALSAAMAVSLLIMACRYTLGKEKYKKHQTRIKSILARCLVLKKRFEKLTDDDIKAYTSGDMDRSVQVPAQVGLSSWELMQLIYEAIDKTSSRLASDVTLAAFLAESSFLACFIYVEVNLDNPKVSAAKYRGLVSKLNGIKKKIRAMRKRIEVKIGHSA